MVKVRAERPFFGVYGKVNAGDVVDVSEGHARRYQERGMAYPVEVGGKAAPKPKNKMEDAPANKSDASPSQTRPSGGRTGAETPASSSQEAQAPRKRTSRKRKEKPAP